MSEAAAAQAGTDTGATNQSTEATGQPAGQSQNDASWESSFDSESKNWVASKGWSGKKADEVLPLALKSYQNSEKLISQIKGDPNRILVMPKDMTNKEEVAALYEKLGTPKDTEGYGFDPKNEGLLAYAQKAKELNLTKEQAQGVFAWADEIRQQQEQVQEQEEAQWEESSKAELAQWQKEMGAAYEEKLNVAKSAFNAFPEIKKHSSEIERVLGTREYMNLVYSLGAKIGEAGAAGPNPSNVSGGGLTPSQAKQAIQELNATKSRELLDMSHPGHSAAKAELQRLSKFAYVE